MAAAMRRATVRGWAAKRAAITVGMWTKPYRYPRGTVAVQVTAIEGESVTLSDGDSMHWSHVSAVPADWVAGLG